MKRKKKHYKKVRSRRPGSDLGSEGTGFPKEIPERIVNLLNRQNMTIDELCQVLGTTQPIISKHLVNMELMNIVGYNLEGRPYYYLITPKDYFHERLIDSFLKRLPNSEIFKKDLSKLKRLYSGTQIKCPVSGVFRKEKYHERYS